MYVMKSVVFSLRRSPRAASVVSEYLRVLLNKACYSWNGSSAGNGGVMISRSAIICHLKRPSLRHVVVVLPIAVPEPALFRV